MLAQKDKSIEVKADIPGVDKNDIKCATHLRGTQTARSLTCAAVTTAGSICSAMGLQCAVPALYSVSMA